MMDYMKLEDGSKIKFPEEVIFCSTREAFDVNSGARVGGLEVNGKWIDSDEVFYNVKELKKMEKVLKANGFINEETNNIAIPAGEVAEVKSYDHDITYLTFKDGAIGLTLVSQFKTVVEEEWDILIEMV